MDPSVIKIAPATLAARKVIERFLAEDVGLLSLGSAPLDVLAKLLIVRLAEHKPPLLVWWADRVKVDCQVIDFDCSPDDLCSHCGGTGDEPREELCCHCDQCFDEEIGWSTGIRPGSSSQERARRFVK